MKKHIVLALFVVLWLSCSKDKPVKPDPIGNTFLPSSSNDISLNFVTFNMAVGFDAEQMLTKDLSNPKVVLTEGRYLYDQIKQSKPRERVRSLADSLAHTVPDIICLQEVLYLVNHQNSDTVDFMKILLSRLDSLGGPHYTMIHQIINPLTIKVTVTDTTKPDSIDIFFNEGNVILYKNDVLTLEAADSLSYFFGIRNLKYLNSSYISILRGAVYAKFKTDSGTLVNVFNTHLEVESVPLLGMNQAYELRDYISSKSLDKEAVVVMGDFNDQPEGKSVKVIKDQNFIDTYDNKAGFTCCFEFSDVSIQPTQRIDYILAKSIVSINYAFIGLNETFRSDNTDYRISDHAGVFAGLTFH